MDSTAAAPVVLVTNDDGIDAPGLRFLVEQLVASQRFRVLVSAPDMSVFQTLVESRSLPRSCPLPFLQFPSFVACLVGSAAHEDYAVGITT
jgi:broad specificity polyphosphatase/5'/3'-nucleotidase SurE